MWTLNKVLRKHCNLGQCKVNNTVIKLGQYNVTNTVIWDHTTLREHCISYIEHQHNLNYSLTISISKCNT